MFFCGEESEVWDGYEFAEQRVIHSDLLSEGFLEGETFVAGNRLTKEFCARHNVPHRTTGKLVVAKDASENGAGGAEEKGEDYGVEGLRLIDAAEIRRQEPHVKDTPRWRCRLQEFVPRKSWCMRMRGWRRDKARIW